jgi:hypothetical protein
MVSLLDACENHLKHERVDEAVAKLRPVANQHPVLRMHYGRSLFQMGETEEARQIFSDLIQVECTQKAATVLLARVLQAIGEPTECRRFATQAIMSDHDSRDLAFIIATTYMDEGNVARAHRAFDGIVARDPKDVAFYLRELCHWILCNLDVPDASPDELFTGQFKETHVCREPVAMDVRCLGYFPETRDCPAVPRPILPCDDDGTLLHVADTLGQVFRLSCPGFVHNRRVCRAMALAALEAAAGLRSQRYSNMRSFMNVFVRWRRTAAASDGVWWGTKSNPNTHTRTPLHRHGGAVFRYHMYLPRALERIRGLALNEPSYADCHGRLRGLHTLTPQKLHEVLVRPGTRVVHFPTTLSPTGLPGVYLDISQTPAGDDYEVDVLFALSDARADLFTAVLDCALANHLQDPHDVAAIARFYYLWINFQCLSRGSAICGLAAVLAMCLHHGVVPRSFQPPMVQWDWEAILASSEDDVCVRMVEHLFHTSDAFAEDVGRAALDHCPTAGTPISRMYHLLGRRI